MDNELTPEAPSSINEGFVFDILIKGSSELFQAEPLRSNVQNVADMTVHSNWYTRHQDCQDDAINVLKSMREIVSSTSGRPHILAIKLNPIHTDASYDVTVNPDQWDQVVVMKIFLCDSEILKKENRIDGHVCAIISAAPRINLAKSNQLITQ
jgi:hypothetical protein